MSLGKLAHQLTHLGTHGVLSTFDDDALLRKLRWLLGEIIAGEGILGAGKTTMLRLLQQYFVKHGILCILTEEDPNAKVRAYFYQNPQANAHLMQVYMLSKRQQAHDHSLIYAGRHPHFICKEGQHVVLNDRSIVGDEAFALEHMRVGNIKPGLQTESYKSLVSETAPYRYSYFVFFDVEPEVAHHRVIHMRKNPSEANMPLSYLQDLRRSYYFIIREQCLAGKIRLVYVYNDPFVEPEYVVGCLLDAPTVHQVCEWYETGLVPQLEDSATPDQVRDAFKAMATCMQRHYAAVASAGVSLKSSGSGLLRPPSTGAAAAACRTPSP